MNLKRFVDTFSDACHVAGCKNVSTITYRHGSLREHCPGRLIRLCDPCNKAMLDRLVELHRARVSSEHAQLPEAQPDGTPAPGSA